KLGNVVAHDLDAVAPRHEVERDPRRLRERRIGERYNERQGDEPSGHACHDELLVDVRSGQGQSGLGTVHVGRWPNRSTKVTSCAGFRGATPHRPVGKPSATMLASIQPSLSGTASLGKISAWCRARLPTGTLPRPCARAASCRLHTAG